VDIASGLARTAGLWRPHLAEHRTQRSGIRLVAGDDYDAWLLRWPPRTSVTPHDHGESSGAFTVVHGELLEIRWRGALSGSRLVTPGDVVTIEPGIVHDVIATGHDAALSVHVYSPPLREMGYYDDNGQTLVDRQPVVETAPGRPLARAIHPSGVAPAAGVVQSTAW
jgi:quercetin dioxygenase-like cupin family protein